MTGSDSARSSAVADEAVRLVSALAAMAPPPPGDAGSTANGSEPVGDDATGTDDAPREHETRDDEPPRGGSAGCSCTNPSVQAICEVCPVCRVAAFLSEVRPETVERVADLLSMVAGSLEAFAAQRRAETGAAPRRSTSTPGPRQDASWESVHVEDEDEDGER